MSSEMATLQAMSSGESKVCEIDASGLAGPERDRPAFAGVIALEKGGLYALLLV